MQDISNSNQPPHAIVIEMYAKLELNMQKFFNILSLKLDTDAMCQNVLKIHVWLSGMFKKQDVRDFSVPGCFQQWMFCSNKFSHVHCHIGNFIT